MDTADPPLAFVIIAGPQASGKSTLAAALRTRLLERGERVALTELDQIAAMALPTLPSWEAAHHIFEATTALWAKAAMTCVIAEGSGSAAEVTRLRDQAPSAAVVVTVAVTTTLETAFDRARSDPTRGISQEHDFLSGVYRHWPGERAAIAPDVVVDTSNLTVQEGTRRIVATIDRARRRA